MVKLKIYDNGLIVARFKSQYEATSTMIRPQEFYESPFKHIKGKYFTLDTFMDAYVKWNSEFSYFTDWDGFNIPGNVLLKFILRFAFRYRKKEWEVIKQIPLSMLLGFKKFYIIGIYNNDALMHETAHALYYLDLEYRRKVDERLHRLTLKQLKKWTKYLKQIGYANSVLMDEIHAYMLEKKDKQLVAIYKQYNRRK